MLNRTPRSHVLTACLALAMLGCTSASLQASPAQTTERPIIGRIENVQLQDIGVVLKGRIDSGAGVSSLHADILEIRKSTVKGKPDRVAFLVENKDGKKIKVERDVIDWMRIKKKDGNGYINRPVIRLDICIGGKQIESRVNLADRGVFLYPVLIGRNTLKTGDFLIDPKVKFTSKPTCPTKPPK